MFLPFLLPFNFINVCSSVQLPWLQARRPRRLRHECGESLVFITVLANLLWGQQKGRKIVALAACLHSPVLFGCSIQHIPLC